MPKAITINTVQGIGDIFWCYQKLAPYFDRININVMCLSLVSLQMRAKAFCKMLPKVGAVNFVVVKHEQYQRVACGRFPLADLVLQDLSLDREPVVDYSVNAPLEQGVNLADIDPGSELASPIDLGLRPEVERGDYLCAFVSGTRNDLCWSPGEWLAAIRVLAQRLGTNRVKLIGAQWDKGAQDFVEAGLKASGYEVTNHTGHLELADSINVIRGARFFVGFQSGLGVIADNYDVPQLMLYYRSLVRMSYTWCKPENARRVFHAATFNESTEAIVARLGVLSAGGGGTVSERLKP